MQPEDILADLNEPQRQAVTHVDGPLLVLAGAGSGKTRVITRRVAYLVSQGIAPWNILAITFTNKAAAEMRQRVESLGTPRGVLLATFHALCARLLRELAEPAALPRNFTIYDRDDQIRAVKAAMQQAEVPADRLSPGAVHSTISTAKNDLVTAEQYAASAADFYSRTVAKVYRQYEQVLSAAGALDFDDLLLRTAFLLRDRPDIRMELGRRFRYILIDEYQDTNRAQYLLAHGIAMEHENICATGDPDQSIYAWRGADIRNIMDFEKDYPNAKVVRLEENYRSCPPILAAASSLISRNRNRKEKSLWTRRPDGPPVRVLACADEHAEAREIARRITRAAAAGRSHDQIAVFYRVNSLSRLIEQMLLRAGIPYRVARGVEFYNRKEIRDVLAYLRLLANASDDLACRRAINVPPRGIGDATVDKLLAHAQRRGISLLAACAETQQAGLNSAGQRKVGEFAHLMAVMATGLDRPVQQVMAEVLRRTGIEHSLEAGGEDEAQAKANVDELLSAAREFDDLSPQGRLPEFLQQVSLVSDVDHFEGGSGAVTLMTLHAAKGLEFPVVFVAGWEEGLLPFMRNDASPQSRPTDIEEERRLAFVGMTRAMEELTLTCARRRMLRGHTEARAASPFLGEIGRQNVVVETIDDEEDASGPAGGAWQPRRPPGEFYDDASTRQAIESMEDHAGFPHEYEYLREGSRVRHAKFGTGKVLRLRMPWPETRVDVFFDDYGPKTLVLRNTRLELL
jgi:DNA helicase-2/ATP-dependent DNA helicase PcrA